MCLSSVIHYMRQIMFCRYRDLPIICKKIANSIEASIEN